MFYLAQAGSSLQRVDPDGTVTTLTLPSGVTIDATINGIFAVLGSVNIFAKLIGVTYLPKGDAGGLGSILFLCFVFCCR